MPVRVDTPQGKRCEYIAYLKRYSVFAYITSILKQILHTQPSIPIFWAHGTADTEIPLAYAEESIAFLRHTLRVPGCALRVRVYDGLAHSIRDDELDDLALWLRHILQ